MARSLRLFLVTFLPTLLARFRRGPARPTWSFLFEWTIRFLRRDWDESAQWPLERQRAGMAAKPYPAPSLKKVTVRDEVIAGVPVRRFTPPSPGATRIVFFHGGSYIYGSTRHSHAELCAHLAAASSLEVLGVEYRLAPEHPWPAQLEDAKAVCSSLEGALVLAGDSAGGHLVVRTAQAVARKPVALVLLSPWVDFEMPGASFTSNDAFDFGTREGLLRHAKAVAGDRPLAELALDASGDLPPTFVSVGGAETPRDDILRYVEALRAAKVEVTLNVAEDLPHNATLFEAWHPQAKAAFDAMVAFVSRGQRPQP
jgi:monoterpene epsilon-lactone hydrolase